MTLEFPTVAALSAWLDEFAPPSLAASWDNVGLLIGEPTRPVQKLMTCLTLTPDVATEAIQAGVQMIVSHHPILFRATKKLLPGTPDGDVVLPLLANRIAVYSPHTAFDNCPGGINDGLARRLGLVEVRALRLPVPKPSREYKLVVFVPTENLDTVANAMFAVGAGRIGNYDQCSFRTPGTGTFFGNDAANPTIGKKLQRESVAEDRLEVIVPEANVGTVLNAMRRSHLYETPAFDLYPRIELAPAREGRIGRLPTPLPLLEVASIIQKELQPNTLQQIGEPTREISTIAIACGAAGEFLPDAIKAKADLFLTGELRFHECLSARSANLAVLLPGHYATERPGVEDLATTIATAFPQLQTWPSRVERDPLCLAVVASS